MDPTDPRPFLKHRSGIQVEQWTKDQGDAATPPRQRGAGSVGTVHQQEYVEQVERDRQEKASQQPMADPFAFLLVEQESAQEKQLENDQYKENAGEVEPHAPSK